VKRQSKIVGALTFCGLFFCSYLLATENIQHKKNESLECESVNPEFIYSFRHYAKFFGCPKTVRGSFFKRSYIFNSLNGFRDRFYDEGIYLDASVNQFFGVNHSGGEKHGFMRANGSTEYWLIFDLCKIGMWSNGVFMLHAKTTWLADESIVEDVGAIAAANIDPKTPVSGTSTTALSEVALAQKISDYFSFRIGKLDATGPFDSNEFANSSRHQFIYSGLSNNPIVITFLPHTLLSIIPKIKLGDRHTILFLAGDADGSADESGFSTLFDGSSVYCVQYQFSPIIQGAPGNYRVIGCYSTKPIMSYAIDSRHVLGKKITDITIPDECNNYAWLFSLDQYFCKKENGEGVGIFARAGWAPDDRNVIDRFYSIGFGGHGMIFKNRPHDEWGIGYAATHISYDLRQDLKELDIDFNSYEHAVEIFYNIELSPAIHWTIHAQVIQTPLVSRQTAFAVTSRIRIDF